MLTVVKSLNNNIILATTEHEEELVAFGTGIGFKRKKGDKVDIKQATKVFQTGVNTQVSQLLEGLSAEILAVTKEIIELGEARLEKKLSPSILFTLADHLTFAIERESDDLAIETPFQWEIPHLYFNEYEIGKAALVLIKEQIGVELATTEASFIALHFVNAQTVDQNMGQTIQITQVTKEIVKIIQSLFEITLDKTTLTYSRFITHLRYFIARQESGDESSIEMDSALKAIIQERYIKSYACGLMIKEMLKKEFNWHISEDELVYLVIHIERITTENKK